MIQQVNAPADRHWCSDLNPQTYKVEGENWPIVL